jgi:branched-chain amino acid aminotransferase
LAKIQANQAGADDALMLDSRGFVAETNATHIFLVKDGMVSTPRTVACPEGITRSVVLQLCRDHHIPHDTLDLSLTDVYRADEIFCTGTMGELVPVVEVDGRAIGNALAGPVWQRLAEFFADLTRREGTPIVEAACGDR